MGSVAAVWSAGGADVDSVRRMLEASPHRGLQMSVLVHGQVALGTGNQPGWDDASLASTEGFTAVLLGRVDNASDLWGALGGPTGSESSDASLIASMFRKWEAEAIGRLRGAFAGVVTDGERLWCFRDHIGGRPMFYRRAGGEFFCASEPKQVTAGAQIERRPNLEAVTVHYYRGIGEASAIEGVDRLMHGEVAALSAGGALSTSRHWDPSGLLESSKLHTREVPEALAEVLERVVSRSVSGEDAIALSGGIDSPTIAAFAAPAHLERFGRSLQAYTLVYPRHSSVDESKYTEAVANYLGMPLHKVDSTANHLDDIEHWVDLADGPWDSLPMAVAAQGYAVARKAGARRILTGTLAEYVYTVNQFFLGHLLLHGRWSALARQFRMRRRAGRRLLGLSRQLVKEVVPAPLAKAYAILARRTPGHLPQWVDMTVIDAPRYSTSLAAPVRRRWLHPTLQATRGTTSTMEAIEICAGSLGVTVNHPLADRDLWEFFLSLPAEVKYPDLMPKSLIRQAMRGRLPDVILDRTDKTVFDENVLDTIPFEHLKQLLFNSEYRMPGVDYELLASRLDERVMHPAEVVWAYDLATVHAFVGRFG